MFRLANIPRVEVPERVVAALGSVLAHAPVRDAAVELGRDESGAGEFPPGIVVYPQSTAEVAQVMHIASASRIPVTPRGAGSGKSGGCLPVAGGILLVTQKLSGISELSREDNLAVVRPGTIVAELHAAAAKEQRFYPPDPASAEWCSVGGTVAENAGGPRAFKYGVTRDYVLGLEAVLPSGEIIRTGRRSPKGVAGYDLCALLCGSEGSLAIITELTLKLIPAPRQTATAFLGFASLSDASHAVTRIIDAGEQPACLELLDPEALAAVSELLRGISSDATGAAIVIELDGDGDLLERLSRIAEIAACTDCLVAADGKQRRRIWDARKGVSQALQARYHFKISEDICVPRSRIPQMIADVRRIAEPRGFAFATYGHAGDGNLHTNLLWNDPARAERLDDTLAAIYTAAVSHGGTITGEHGVGLVKREFLHIEQPPGLIALQRRVKAAFDPLGILNPHKLFPAERDALRAGP